VLVASRDSAGVFEAAVERGSDREGDGDIRVRGVQAEAGARLVPGGRQDRAGPGRLGPISRRGGGQLAPAGGRVCAHGGRRKVQLQLRRQQDVG